MNRVDDEAVLTLLHHPNADFICAGAGFRDWQYNKSKEENILAALHKIIITGHQDELIGSLNEPHFIKTEDGIIDLNEIAKNHLDDEMDPIIAYVAKHNMMYETGYRCDSVSGKRIIYRDQNDNIRSELVNVPWNDNFTIMYKEFLGVIDAPYPCGHHYDEWMDKCTLITNKSKVLNMIACVRHGRFIQV
jgi:hypothetical protein